MLKVEIPNDIPKIIEPKIPFTKIPNPLGTAKRVYSNGIEGYIPLYYLQKTVFSIIKKIKCAFYKERYKKIKKRAKYFVIKDKSIN